MFEILNIHCVFKCLTRTVEGLGPNIDIETVKSFAEKADYRVGNRKIPTQRGPLFEYIFYRESSPENKLFFSRNGFSVDVTSIISLIELVREAYEWYEVGTQTPTFKPTVESIIECFIYSPKYNPLSSMKKLFPAYIKRPLEGFGKQLSVLSLSLTSTYFPKKEKENLIVTVEPFKKSPIDTFRVMVVYKPKTIDEIFDHLQTAETNVIKLLKRMFVQRKKNSF